VLDDAGDASCLETTKAVSATEPCYGVDDPALGRRGYPGSLVLESLVQSAAVLWGRKAWADGLPDGSTLLLIGARDIAFHGCAEPGDTLRHRVQLISTVGSNAFLSGETTLLHSGGPVLSVGQIVLALRAAESR
jgi:3-hydroxymyristoyl/3-hydroxydecanoyl-(acyl carrier protein) dehydratase